MMQAVSQQGLAGAGPRDQRGFEWERSIEIEREKAFGAAALLLTSECEIQPIRDERRGALFSIGVIRYFDFASNWSVVCKFILGILVPQNFCDESQAGGRRKKQQSPRTPLQRGDENNTSTLPLVDSARLSS